MKKRKYSFRLLAYLHFIFKIALIPLLVGILSKKFFDRKYSYPINTFCKIFSTICTKMANFSNKSKIRKKSFLLIEVMISLSLLSLVLGTLFFWYHNFSKEKKESTHLVQLATKEREAEIQLERVMSRVKKDIFFLSDNELIFVFDNGTKKESLLSDAVLATIYFDKNKKALCLTIWPHPKTGKQEPSYTSVLLKEISDLQFKFYYPNISKNKIDPKKVGSTFPQKGWQETWKKEYETIPAIIQITIKKDDRLLEWAYHIDEGKEPIVYWRS